MSKETQGIYFTHVPPGMHRRLVGIKARVNGRLAIAFIKDDKVLGYELLEDVNRQVLEGPCVSITVPDNS